MTKTIMRRERSAALFAEARLRIPGGVNSPVRACANVGCDPVFYERAEGSRVVDVDGNEYIDLSELHEYRDAKELIDSFREYGVEAFTFSSGWSSATGSAWTFLQNGCTLTGMVEINGPHKALGSDTYEKRPAFLFRVQ